MKTNVVITVDTEPSVAGAFERGTTDIPLIDEPVCGLVGGRSEALGFLIRTLRNNAMTATFFVETVHVAHFSPEAMQPYVRQLLDAKQDVQLHLHPCWSSFENGLLDPDRLVSDACAEASVEDLSELMEKGIKQIERWGGQRPTSLRTGNFSTSLAVFQAMAQTGLLYSSNVCCGVNPPDELELKLPHGMIRPNGIIELPVTCFREVGPIGRGKWKPMQTTAVSEFEQIRILDKAHAANYPTVVIVTHPFEFIKREGHRFQNIRPNRLIQKRFEKVCQYLTQNSDRFSVVPLATAAKLALKQEERNVDLNGSTVLSIARAIVNYTNDKII